MAACGALRGKGYYMGLGGARKGKHMFAGRMARWPTAGAAGLICCYIAGLKGGLHGHVVPGSALH
jgi:hypothetical protein